MNQVADHIKMGILDKEDIAEIYRVLADPSWADPRLMMIGTGITRILKMDTDSNLILVEGTDETAHRHITARHSYFTKKAFWRESGKLDNPTKFPMDIGPFGYFYLACEIFKYWNKLIPEPGKDEFDIYEGQTGIYRGMIKKFRLLTYRDTGVIHTFYLLDSSLPFNKNKKPVVHLAEEWTSATENIMSCVTTINKKYNDIAGTTMFIIKVNFDKVRKTERWFLQVNDLSGNPFETKILRSNGFNTEVKSHELMTRLNHENITWVEKMMRDLMAGKKLTPTPGLTF